MASGTLATVISIGGFTINKTVTRTGDHPNPYQVTLPAGKAGTLSTRTDNDTGVITSTGHGIEETDKVDVYWTGGMRYGMTVSSHDANTLTVDAGTGDNFPAQDTAVVAVKRVQINTSIDGDNVQLAGILLEMTDQNATNKGSVDFQDASNATIMQVDLSANQPWSWDSGSGQANPMTGNPITKCYASNGSSTASATLTILTLEDSTP